MSSLCLTLGDPLGIGPEICVKFLSRHLGAFGHTRFHVVGPIALLNQTAHSLGLDLPFVPQVTYHDIDETLSPGLSAYQGMEQAVSLIAQNQADAVVTGPVSKQHLQDAGILASGQTELMALLSRRYFPQHPKTNAQMLFMYHGFRLLLLTRHIPLSQVPQTLASQNNVRIVETLCHFLQGNLGISRPRLALLGVNPHAGEIGGVEETLIFGPLREHVEQTDLARLEGPFAADAFFRGFNPQHPGYDAVIAAYHDQGLIPFKLLAGFKAVNVTIGLPFLRTAVGHGTAMDIAGKGRATEESLVAAVETAITLTRHQKAAIGS